MLYHPRRAVSSGRWRQSLVAAPGSVNRSDRPSGPSSRIAATSPSSSSPRRTRGWWSSSSSAWRGGKEAAWRGGKEGGLSVAIHQIARYVRPYAEARENMLERARNGAFEYAEYAVVAAVLDRLTA